MGMRTHPKVAIVIPTFNRRDFVQKAIESSISQTYPCEIIVCDHGSTDDTQKVMVKYGDKIKYVRREKDFGPHFCWLDGILNTDAEFIHLQFDDDWIDKKFIETSMSLIRKDVGMVIGNAIIYNEENGLQSDCFKFKKLFGKNGVYSYKKLERKILSGWLFSPGASLFRRKDLLDALYQGDLPNCPYPSYHGVGPDSFITLLAMLRYKKIGVIVDNLVFFRSHKGSITVNAGKDKNKEKHFELAYRNVLVYYYVLKRMKFFYAFRFLAISFWVRKINYSFKIFLKKIGLFNVFQEIYYKIRR